MMQEDVYKRQMCLFTIDNDSKKESKEVTKEGCKYSPADCPSEYSTEYITKLTTKSKHLSEWSEACPVEQYQMITLYRIICKGHWNHEQQW